MSVQIPNMFVIEKAETGQFLRREAIMLKTRKRKIREKKELSLVNNQLSEHKTRKHPNYKASKGKHV